MSRVLLVIDLEGRSVAPDVLACASSAELRRPSRASVVEARGRVGGALYVPAPGLEAPPGLTLSADVRLDAREDLVRALSLEHADRPPCDEDLLLHGYARWGPELLERITGDFAFALHDAGEDCVLLATDLLASRPLCHAVHGGRIVAASSARALVRAGLVPAAWDEEHVLQSLVPMLEVLGMGRTPYRHVARLLPGERLVWRHGRGPERARAPLIVDASVAPGGIEDHRAELRRGLEVAVAERLGADGGVMLSGGIDSCAVTAVACAMRQREGGDPPSTFSVLHDDASRCPESPGVRALVARWAPRSTYLHPSGLGDLRDELLSLLNRLEDPYDSLVGLIPCSTMVLARRAGVPVMLTGVDGDLATSLGANLPAYALARGWVPTAVRMARGAARHRRMSALGLFWREGLKLLLPRALRAGWRRLAAVEARWVRTEVRSSGLCSRVVSSLELEDRLREARRLYWPDIGAYGDAPQQRHVARLSLGFMPAALARYERCAAAAGLELRHPLTAAHLLRACARMPWWAKDLGGVTKGLLRAAVADVVPEIVRKAPVGRGNMSGVLASAWRALPGVEQAWQDILRASNLAQVLTPERLAALTGPGEAAAISMLALWGPSQACGELARSGASAPEVHAPPRSDV